MTEVFHPLAEQQKTLRVDWANGAGAQTLALRGYAAAGSGGIDYREIVYYYRFPAADGTSHWMAHLSG